VGGVAVNFQLQRRRPHGRYETVASSADALGLRWGFNQCIDPRYASSESVRIIDVTSGQLRIVVRVKVGEP
jgi:hypothetical protein